MFRSEDRVVDSTSSDPKPQFLLCGRLLCGRRCCFLSLASCQARAQLRVEAFFASRKTSSLDLAVVWSFMEYVSSASLSLPACYPSELWLLLTWLPLWLATWLLLWLATWLLLWWRLGCCFGWRLGCCFGWRLGCRFRLRLGCCFAGRLGFFCTRGLGSFLFLLALRWLGARVFLMIPTMLVVILSSSSSSFLCRALASDFLTVVESSSTVWGRRRARSTWLVMELLALFNAGGGVLQSRLDVEVSWLPICFFPTLPLWKAFFPVEELGLGEGFWESSVLLSYDLSKILQHDIENLV